MSDGISERPRDMGSLVRAAFSVPLMLLLVGLTSAPADVAFFKTTKDKEVYARNPGMYEEASFPLGVASEVVYVERNPSLKIQRDEIELVVIEERQVTGSVEELMKQLEGRESKKKRAKGAKESSVYYTATFYLTQKGARRFNEFANKNERQFVDVKLGSHRLGPVMLLGPFSGNTFTTELMENNADRIKNIFSSIKGKVKWR